MNLYEYMNFSSVSYSDIEKMFKGHLLDKVKQFVMTKNMKSREDRDCIMVKEGSNPQYKLYILTPREMKYYHDLFFDWYEPSYPSCPTPKWMKKGFVPILRFEENEWIVIVNEWPKSKAYWFSMDTVDDPYWKMDAGKFIDQIKNGTLVLGESTGYK